MEREHAHIEMTTQRWKEIYVKVASNRSEFTWLKSNVYLFTSSYDH